MLPRGQRLIVDGYPGKLGAPSQCISPTTVADLDDVVVPDAPGVIQCDGVTFAAAPGGPSLIAGTAIAPRLDAGQHLVHGGSS
jgi:hypothetical protein